MIVGCCVGVLASSEQTLPRVCLIRTLQNRKPAEAKVGGSPCVCARCGKEAPLALPSTSPPPPARAAIEAPPAAQRPAVAASSISSVAVAAAAAATVAAPPATSDAVAISGALAEFKASLLAANAKIDELRERVSYLTSEKVRILTIAMTPRT